MAVDAVAGPPARPLAVVKAYVALTKPRIIELLLVTTVPAMFLAADGLPPWTLILVTLVGGTFAAASANSFNSVLDADMDQKMRRTRRRPMARHQIRPSSALVFGVALGILSTLILGLGANWLSATLALTANAIYVFIYTMWLKRRTWQNIVWGGIAGCFPPLIGWTAVTGQVAWPPFILFLIVFLWTPPHTWALAFRYKEDYEAGGVPMLPVVRPPRHVAMQMFWYSVAMVAVSLLLWPLTPTGPLYPAVAAVLGAMFLFEAAQLWRRANAGLDGSQLKAMRLFHWSNTYLALLFLAVALDPLLF